MTYWRGTGLVSVLTVGLRPLLSTSKHLGSEIFLLHNNSHGNTPRAQCIAEVGCGSGLSEHHSSQICLSLFPVQPPLYAGCRLYEKGTLPRATFIYEASILTMATSVRWREEHKHKPGQLSLSMGWWGTGTGTGRRLRPLPYFGGKRLLTAIVPKKTQQTQPPA